MTTSEFRQGIAMLLRIADEVVEHGYAQEILVAAAKMTNDYYALLVRLDNQLDTEIELIEHAMEHMPRTIYPGDLRAERGES